MVSKAIDEGLLLLIQTYVANDINKKIVMEGRDAAWKVAPQDVYILSFTRILNNWQATATAEADASGFYQLTHDGGLNKTLVKIYLQQFAQEAII